MFCVGSRGIDSCVLGEKRGVGVSGKIRTGVGVSGYNQIFCWGRYVGVIIQFFWWGRYVGVGVSWGMYICSHAVKLQHAGKILTRYTGNIV